MKKGGVLRAAVVAQRWSTNLVFMVKFSTVCQNKKKVSGSNLGIGQICRK